MLAAQTDSVDRALWAALRALEERAALLRRMAQRARRRKHRFDTAFDERADAAEAHATIVRDVLLNRSASHVVPDHTNPDAPPAAVLDEKNGE